MRTNDLAAEPLPALVKGTGPGLLLAHGAGGSPELNFPFIDDLARRHTVVAPYYPGTGPAPRAATPLSADDLADRLVATAVDAGLASFAMLGYSLGVPLTIRAAARHPERVRALALTAGFAHARTSMQSAGALWAGLLARGDQESLAHFLAFFCGSEAGLSALSSDDYARLVETLRTPPPPGAPDQVDLVQRIDVRADLPRIAVPTLVVATTADTLVAPAHSAELLDAIPGARGVSIDSGHLIGAERPDEWHRAIEHFLQTLDTE
ncbi:alpha/beta fold hydrolase [Actinocorallia sp. B10E7]|uniref:alpha/beta fold hydrolase n=1 Tax=Actinocorallia sp. B10E7 TaxID=3153558 RepID=UPI00325DFD7C